MPTAKEVRSLSRLRGRAGWGSHRESPSGESPHPDHIYDVIRPLPLAGEVSESAAGPIQPNLITLYIHGSAAISAFTFGTPRPVTMSYPAPALKAPLLPDVMSRKLLLPASG